MGVSGTFSDGFRMNVLPQAMANGYIHIGTMAGKLNGVMPAQTPIGWRMVWQSMPRGHVLERIAHHQAGHAAAHFHHLDGAAHFAARVVERLAVFGGQHARQLLRVLFEKIFEAVEHLHAIHHRHLAPLQERLVRGTGGAVDVFASGIRDTGNNTRGGGIGDVVQRPASGRLLHAPFTKNFRVSIAVSVASMMYFSSLPSLEHGLAFLPECGDALPEIIGLVTGLLRHRLAVERFGQGVRFAVC